MQCTAGVSRVVGSDAPITVWNAQSLLQRRRAAIQLFQSLSDMIDELGRRSRVAQGLAHVLTSTQRLLDVPDHRCYLFATDAQFVGLIKVGPKKLFVRTKQGQLAELSLLCVLDFYVHESHQRHGVGRALFDAMLEREGVDPAAFGYDRPSPKLLAFLRKHFGLADFVPQSNNFVVFVRHRLSMFKLRAWFRKSYHGAIWPNIRRMRASRLSSNSGAGTSDSAEDGGGSPPVGL